MKSFAILSLAFLAIASGNVITRFEADNHPIFTNIIPGEKTDVVDTASNIEISHLPSSIAEGNIEISHLPTNIEEGNVEISHLPGEIGGDLEISHLPGEIEQDIEISHLPGEIEQDVEISHLPGEIEAEEDKPASEAEGKPEVDVAVEGDSTGAPEAEKEVEAESVVSACEACFEHIAALITALESSF